MTMRDSELMKSLEGAPVGWAVAASAEIERLWDALALANDQIAELGLYAERYRWERENPAWETEIYLSGLTPEEYDAAIDKARSSRA